MAKINIIKKLCIPDFGRASIKPGRFPDLVNLLHKFSCASNLACLYTLALTSPPRECVGQSFSYLFKLAFIQRGMRLQKKLRLINSSTLFLTNLQ